MFATTTSSFLWLWSSYSVLFITVTGHSLVKDLPQEVSVILAFDSRTGSFLWTIIISALQNNFQKWMLIVCSCWSVPPVERWLVEHLLKFESTEQFVFCQVFFLIKKREGYKKSFCVTLLTRQTAAKHILLWKPVNTFQWVLRLCIWA